MAQKTQTLKLSKVESPKPWYGRLLSGGWAGTSITSGMAGPRSFRAARPEVNGSPKRGVISRALRLIGSPLSYLNGLYQSASLLWAEVKLEAATERLEAVVGPHDPQVLHCRETLRLVKAHRAAPQSRPEPHRPKPGCGKN